MINYDIIIDFIYSNFLSGIALLLAITLPAIFGLGVLYCKHKLDCKQNRGKNYEKEEA